jgi:hypothetical protein
MNDIDPKILIALIGGSTAIFAAIIARFTALAVATRAGKKDSDKNAIEYLNRKIQLLEQNKQRILKVNRKPRDMSGSIAEQLADGTQERFQLAGEVIEDVDHYLKKGSCNTLHDQLARINESMAFHKGLNFGVIKSPDDWTGDKSRLIEGSNMIESMNSFSDSVYDMIDRELRESAKQVEQLTGLL